MPTFLHTTLRNGKKISINLEHVEHVCQDQDTRKAVVVMLPVCGEHQHSFELDEYYDDFTRL